jgi:hypothetical protein
MFKNAVFSAAFLISALPALAQTPSFNPAPIEKETGINYPEGGFEKWAVENKPLVTKLEGGGL